ncbi:MAG: hypothetical protein KF773_04980 [Deltaproteobacteria bacterium]|nr:hypothetical protein [Deltaproteobacteria bacterium]MCW5802130.1 hypothetical protein [Deltaproteobacteria bacterium]
MSPDSSLQRWVLPSAEILTVGIPFCVFKLVTGLIAIESPFAVLGYVLVALGALDLALNAGNLVALLVAHRRIGAVCTAELALRGELGLAVDVFVSFGLVAIVVGFGLIARMPAWALPIWNLAVVLNVLGAGGGRLLASVRRVRVAP